MSTIDDVADAVKDSLNGHGFTIPFTATRAYVPVFELKDMGTIHVTVVPRGVELTPYSRTLAQSDVQIDIGIMRKLSAAPAGDVAEIDELMGLVEEIVTFIRTTSRYGVPPLLDAAWIKTANLPIYSPEHLLDIRQFTSVLTVTLRVVTI